MGGISPASYEGDSPWIPLTMIWAPPDDPHRRWMGDRQPCSIATSLKPGPLTAALITLVAEIHETANTAAEVLFGRSVCVNS
jgi:hypothetical protein